MALKLESLKVDIAAQTDGEWRPVAEWKGVRLKCRSLEYPPYQRAREAALIEYTKRYHPDPVPDEEWSKKVGDLLAEYILLEWDGFDEPYDAQRAAVLLSDPAWKILRRKVIEIANQIGTRDIEFIEATVKNSEASSATS